MTKLLIVDDEPFLRTAIRNLIDWESKGYKVVDDVSNGFEAIEAIKKEAPDIILTDIKMPLMDGIGLIKYIEEKKLYIDVVVLSNFDDFNYVKEALLHGASDYILKTSINPQNLIQIIESSKKKSTNRRNEGPASSEQNDEIRKNIQWLKNEFLKNVFTGRKLDLSEIHANIKLYDLNLKDDSYIVISMKIDRFKDVIKKYPDNELKLLNSTVASVVNELLGNGVFLFVNDSTYAILKYVNEISYNNMMSQLFDLLGRIQTAISRCLNFSITLGLSYMTCKIANIPAAYLQSTKAAELRFYYGFGRVINYSDVKNHDWRDSFDELYGKTIRAIRKYLDDLNTTAVKEALNQFIDEIKERHISPDIAKQYIVDILKYAYNLVLEKCVKDNLHTKMEKIYEDINDSETLDQVVGCIDVFSSEMQEHIKDNSSETRNEIIKNALLFINYNYNKELTLISVAKNINVNPSYLSRLFSNETGKNFIDYLTELRIGKAKKLLADSNLTTTDIGLKIGYSNPKYFNRVFKKCTGQTPYNFKKQVNNCTYK